MKKTYEILDHTADIGIICYGKDLQQLFSHAALGLYSLMADINNIKSKLHREISLSSSDIEDLLVDWLNELIYISEVEHIIFNRFEFSKLDNNGLRAQCFGDKIKLERCMVKREIKAATYHMLTITRGKTGYEARILFDI